ncbi:MAG: hypothetical protein IT304_08660 [Dehalococcoidia bacterium]|nr:hypothetical protein [Dehalococcoidia bacterium]
MTFRNAEEAAFTWMQDRQHAPRPMAPMSFWWAQRFEDGFNAGLAGYDLPMRLAVGRFNTYYFMAPHPILPPEEMPVAEARAQEAIRQGLATFAGRWEKEWLPEIQETWRDWEAFNTSQATLSELMGRMERMEDVYRRLWEIHFLLLVPAMVGFTLFSDLYHEVLGGTALEPLRLLQGFDNMSLRAGRGLWALSRKVRANPALQAVVESVPSNVLYRALGDSPAGGAFRADVDAYLAEWGKRSDTVQELSDPSWVENPTPMFDALKAYLRQDEDPDTTHRRLAAERERLLAAVRERLAGQPEELRGQFEFLLEAAQQCSFVQEDHNYWIDQRTLHEVRTLCLEIGRRLSEARVIARAEDVLCLTGAELAALVGGRLPSAPALIAAGRDEMARWERVPAPKYIGTDYGPPPENPVSRALDRFFGGPVELPTPTEVRGNAGSAGRLRGTARVIITIAEAGRLQPGEILVTATTSPPWTPLFAIAGGIVTDTGGALSHCAIVAREYGIPAVVGTGCATAVIRDGQQIEVDGDHGLVRLLD